MPKTDNAKIDGEKLAAGLCGLAAKFPGLISNVCGLGLDQGFSVATPKLRNQLEELALREEGLLLLGAGAQSSRTRPNLSVTEKDIGLLLAMLARCLGRLDL